MRSVLTLSTAGILTMIGLLHAYWACGGRLSIGAAVPQVGGVAALRPSTMATWAVAIALIVAALVVAAAGDLIDPPGPAWAYVGTAIALAIIFAARAIGDFGLVGFFKTRGDGAFARLDTYVYSPLCLILAAAIGAIVATRGDLS
jgi:hypothetical protein